MDLIPRLQIGSGIDFNRFVSITATFYGHQEWRPSIGASFEFGRDQDPQNAVKIAYALLERLSDLRDSIDRKLEA